MKKHQNDPNGWVEYSKRVAEELDRVLTQEEYSKLMQSYIHGKTSAEAVTALKED